ncbi:MAG: hypothetical protein BGO54_13675 [Sphingobacteriales bacterium 46-32]|nr:MAG: hypothetical protein BGO54_13675 [Sphingobacteriales bacterium 46-32]
MKRYFFGIIAVAIAFTAVAFTKAPSQNSKQSGNFTDYYYKFTGAAGEENDMNKWQQLSTLNDYNAFSCPSGSVKGCKIINTTNSSGHPTSVPLDGSGLPTVSGANASVANRN